MNIDRHNYEEYFILYLDDELDISARQQVEAFAAQHPDLKQELEMLLQTRLTPDESDIFSSKTILLKQEPVADYTEDILLYADNELEQRQRPAVEKLVAQNPEAATLLQQIHQVKMRADESIVFPDKNLLYRTASSEKGGAVVRMRWWRAAAAAVLLIGASATVFSLITKSSANEEEQMAVVTVKDPVINNGEAGSKNNQAELPVVPATPGTITNDGDMPISKEAQRTAATSNRVRTGSPVRENSAALTTASSDVAVMEQRTNNLPSPEKNPNARDLFESDKNLTAALSADRKDALTNNKEINAAPAVTTERTNPLHIINAASMETAEPDDVAMESGKKNKLRGFFRKVTRTFEKATNIKATDDEDRLLIAGLAIKL